MRRVSGFGTRGWGGRVDLVQGSEFRVRGSVFSAQCSVFGVQGSEFTDQCAGLMDFGFRVQGSWVSDPG